MHPLFLDFISNKICDIDFIYGKCNNWHFIYKGNTCSKIKFTEISRTLPESLSFENICIHCIKKIPDFLDNFKHKFLIRCSFKKRKRCMKYYLNNKSKITLHCYHHKKLIIENYLKIFPYDISEIIYNYSF